LQHFVAALEELGKWVAAEPHTQAHASDDCHADSNQDGDPFAPYMSDDIATDSDAGVDSHDKKEEKEDTGVDSRDSSFDNDTVDAHASDKFYELEKWLLSTGTSKFPLLYMRAYGHTHTSRGVHTRSDVHAEEEVMCIGREFLITVEMGKACPVGQKIVTATVLNPAFELSAIKHCYLAVFVLTDRRNPKSFFQPYYRILPEHYSNMPIFWSPEEVR
jgi:hypothetical protein